MDVVSKLIDKRINSTNYMVEMPIEEYLSLVKDTFNENEFQRKRVSSSKSVYSLLKSDILKGCLIPPVVLALTTYEKSDRLLEDNFTEFIKKNKNSLVILDGLQRSYTLFDLKEELTLKKEDDSLKIFNETVLRFEIYVGVNRLGILYRMLTLNTGQTPMSIRQQIEMLYLDYSKQEIEGITLIRESDNKRPQKLNEYNFKETLEGFNSYLERNELPIERSDLLENIKSLEKLAEENSNSDIYKEFLLVWNTFIIKLKELTSDCQVSKEFSEEINNIFGKNSTELFKKSQPISGFGAAIGKLKDYKLIADFGEIRSMIAKLHFESLSNIEFMERINTRINDIALNSKKIGNSQRMYFQYFFRELFNKEGDAYCKLDVAVETASAKYNSQVS